jgi:hypothetical protein
VRTSNRTEIGRARTTTFRVNAHIHHTDARKRRTKFNAGEVLVLNDPTASVKAHRRAMRAAREGGGALAWHYPEVPSRKSKARRRHLTT